MSARLRTQDLFERLMLPEIDALVLFGNGGPGRASGGFEPVVQRARGCFREAWYMLLEK